LGLAPIAVLPDVQRQGTGKALTEAGIDKIRASGEPFVIVLGHPDYYPRFGFVPASRLGIQCACDGVPDEVFMILMLKDDVLAGISGVARYRPEFADVT
jgi:putative acetyltransferase